MKKNQLYYWKILIKRLTWFFILILFSCHESLKPYAGFPIQSDPDKNQVFDQDNQLMVEDFKIKKIEGKEFIADTSYRFPKNLQGSRKIGEKVSIPIKLDQLTSKDGIPSNLIPGMYIDREGFLWLIYGNGLIRYDGIDFEFIEEIGEFHAAWCQIYEDPDDHIWFAGSGRDKGSENDMIYYNKTLGIAYKIDLPDPDSNQVKGQFDIEKICGNGDRLIILRGDLGFYSLDYKNISWPSDSNMIGQEQLSNLIKLEGRIPELDGLVRDFFIDVVGNYWFTSDNGLGLFDRNVDQFDFYFPTGDSTDLLGNKLGFMLADQKGGMWIGGQDLLWYFDPSTLRFSTFRPPDNFKIEGDTAYLVEPMSFDSRGILWVFYKGFPSDETRFLWFDPEFNDFTLIDTKKLNPTLKELRVRSEAFDRNGNCWFSPDIGVVYRYTPSKDQFQFFPFEFESDLPTREPNNQMFEDSQGLIWLGAGKELMLFERYNNSYQIYRHDSTRRSSLIDAQIQSIVEDYLGDIWIGTEKGLSRRISEDTYHHYGFGRDYPLNGLKSSDVQYLFLDSGNNLWVSTSNNLGSGFLQRYNRECDCFDDPVLNLSVFEIKESPPGILWLGTRFAQGEGIWSYNLEEENATYHFRIWNQPLYDFEVDTSANIWTTYSNSPIFKYDKASNSFLGYDLYGLLPTNPIYHLLRDKKESIWAVSSSGLIQFDPYQEIALNFYSPDYWMPEGIKWDLRGSSSLEAKDGSFLIKIEGGLFVFHPDRIIRNLRPPQVSIVGVSSNNKRVPAYPGSNFVHHSYKQALVFEYNSNDLSIDYTALHFTDPKRNQFRYMLEGWDEWVDAGTRRSAYYPNLAPGAYTFKLLASNSDGVWMNEDDAATLNITILSPWWATWWAYTLYALLLISGLVSFYLWRSHTQRLRLAEAERLNTRLKQLDLLKDQFLANTSHELRTPLSGIIGIAQSLKDGIAGRLSKTADANLNLIITSGKRLANLVNDILDFSRLKNQELILQKRSVDMHSAVDVVMTLSEPVINKKDLSLINSIPRDIPLVEADENRVQQILHNLIGNAIKFTEKGTVSVSAEVKTDQLEIAVTDTGVGIAGADIDRIFHSFEQADGNLDRQFSGTGLGLSISKQLVELQGGKIWVESKVNEGSIFFFTLPLSSESRENYFPQLELSIESDEAVNKLEVSEVEELEEVQKLHDTPIEDRPRILIVDDEPINLQVLENHLTLAGYSVVKAASGPEALQIIRSHSDFDMIILDIMMPKMSGYEVCHNLRESYLAGQLPIVMLTAKNRVADLVEGFSAGANDYLTKPFTKEELLSRVKIHLHLHRIHRQTGKFVPFEFLRAVGRESITEVQLGDHTEKEVTVFFSDIRNFTAISELMNPKENFQFISRYAGAMAPIVRKYNGFVNQFMGDGIMAIFPKELDQALLAAIEMQQKLKVLNKTSKQFIKVGMGMHSGPLIMGIIGDEKRNDPATISDTVNAASRMESLTKHYGANIILTQHCLKSLRNPDRFHFRYLGKVQVKGKKEALGAYECFDGDPEDVRASKVTSMNIFNQAMQSFHHRKFVLATTLFDRILEDDSSDSVALYFRNRSAKYSVSGVPEDWNGVEIHENK